MENMKMRYVIQLCYGNEEVGISIQNSITRFDSEHQKTGIGLQNISIMMEQMDGRMEVNADDLTYCIVCIFQRKKSIIKFQKYREICWHRRLLRQTIINKVSAE